MDGCGEGTRVMTTPRTWKKCAITSRVAGLISAAAPASTSSTAATSASRRGSRHRAMGRTGAMGRTTIRVRTVAARFGVGGYGYRRPRSRRDRSRSASPSRMGSAIALSRCRRQPQVSRQDRAQATEGSRQSRLHRTLRALKGFRHLGLGQVEEQPIGKDQAVIVAQPPQAVHQRCAEFVRLGRGLGGKGRFPRGLGGLGAVGQGHPPPGGGGTVARLVGDDPQEPRPEGRAGAETGERIVGVHERLLRGVFGVRGVSGDLIGDPKRQLLVLLDECFIGIDVAVSCAFDESGVVQWPALHTDRLLTLHTNCLGQWFPSPPAAAPGHRRPERTALLSGIWSMRATGTTRWLMAAFTTVLLTSAPSGRDYALSGCRWP